MAARKTSKKDIPEILQGYEGLKEYIVKYAIGDYAEARKKLLAMEKYKQMYMDRYKKQYKHNAFYDSPEDKYEHEILKQKAIIAEVTSFFQSQWCYALCEIDADPLIRFSEKKGMKLFENYAKLIEKRKSSGNEHKRA